MHGTTRAEQFQLRVLEVSVDLQDRVAVLRILIHVHDGKLLREIRLQGKDQRSGHFLYTVSFTLSTLLNRLTRKESTDKRNKKGRQSVFTAAVPFRSTWEQRGGRTSMVTSNSVTYTLSMQF